MNYYFVVEDGQEFVVRASKGYLARRIVMKDIHEIHITVIPPINYEPQPMSINTLIDYFEKANMSTEEIVWELKQTKDDVVICPKEYI